MCAFSWSAFHQADPDDMLANVPEFADMAELDAWVESCKKPHRSREPGVLTEEQWAQHRADGVWVGSGNWPRP